MKSARTRTAIPTTARRRPRLVAVSLVLALGLSARADSWTNRAGHALDARLVAIEGEQIVLEQAGGRTQRLPLASLAPADQQRARAQTRSERLPSELSACLAQAREDIQRAAQFLRGGKIDQEEYAARCRQIARRAEALGLQALRERGGQASHASLDLLRRQLAEESDRGMRSATNAGHRLPGEE